MLLGAAWSTPILGVVGPSDAWSAWPVAPASMLSLVVAAGTWVVLARRAGHPGGAAWWWAGLAALAVALLSPIDLLGESLLSVHMVQHLLLGLVAPLLIVRSRPMRVFAHLLHPTLRRELGRSGSRLRRRRGVGVAVVAAHIAVWWAWHVPALYEAAVTHDLIHLAEHTTMFLSGLALWGICWPAGPVRQQGGLAVLGVFAAASGTGALAALLTLAARPHYATDVATARAWGVDRLADEQLAGAIMWVPGGFLYLGVGVALFVAWLGGRHPRDPGLDADRVVLADR